jgi:hypothetical protein
LEKYNPIFLLFQSGWPIKESVNRLVALIHVSGTSAKVKKNIKNSVSHNTSSAEGKAYFSLVALHACSDPQDAKTAREEPGKSQSSRLSQNNQCWKEAYFKQMRCEN